MAIEQGAIPVDMTRVPLTKLITMRVRDRLAGDKPGGEQPVMTAVHMRYRPSHGGELVCSSSRTEAE